MTGGGGDRARVVGETASVWGVGDLGVSYGKREAISGVSLSVEGGAVAAVVGGDGAGKTTLLRALVGAVRPETGWVRRPPRSRVGYQSGRSGVYPDLSVAENVAFRGAAYGARGPDLERRAEELLERTGLGDARHRLGRELSGGMRQKLGLALALLHRPSLLVLDEPTTGVDPISRVELWRLIGRAAAEGAAVVFATTYLDEAERAGQILVLERGRPLALGTAEEIISATPGTVFDCPTRPDAGHRWRRGGRWRAWSPDGSVPGRAVSDERVPGGSVPGDEVRVVVPDLQDAVTVAMLARTGREDLL